MSFLIFHLGNIPIIEDGDQEFQMAATMYTKRKWQEISCP